MHDESIARAFGALGDPHRLRALRFVAERAEPAEDRGASFDAAASGSEPVCACDVQEHLGLSQPATSYHMKVLRDAGLVDAEKRGRWVHYRVSSEGLGALRSFLDLLARTLPAPDRAAT